MPRGKSKGKSNSISYFPNLSKEICFLNDLDHKELVSEVSLEIFNV